ncbi:MAG: hypothetical protein FWC58_01420 [Desulfobulbus sp.]|nr:hypothetical protein [Desulfobulbus sp.]
MRTQTGKSRWQQIREILALHRGPYQLGIEEYYELGIFDDRHYPAAEKMRCLGWKGSAMLDQRMNHSYWRATANDKVLNYALLAHYGFPIPQTLAIWSRAGQRIADEKILSSEAELFDYLDTGSPFPVFIKPIHGTYGRGTFCLLGKGPDGAYLDSRGSTVSRDALLEAWRNRKFGGLLFQKRLRQHPAVEALVGETISCIRLIVALDAETRPEAVLAFWKIGRAANITDNFHMGKSGNLLAGIDIGSGRVERVITGLWPGGVDVSEHPDTGAQLVGAQLPDWSKALALCCEAARHFPGLRLQHWDVAFAEQGPVLMELNTEADLGVPQFLGRKAFVSERVDALMASGS